MVLAIQASAGKKDAAFAAGMFIFMRFFGQSIGIAIGGLIFKNQLKLKLSAYPSLADRATELSEDVSNLVTIEKG